MAIEPLLERLKGVKKTSANTWMAKCSSHEDSRPSLSVRQAEDGRILVNCFGGCSTHEVLGAVGLEMTDLFDDGPLYHRAKPLKGAKVFARDVLKLLITELMIVMISSFDLRKGKALNAVDQARLQLAYERISHGIELAEIE